MTQEQLHELTELKRKRGMSWSQVAVEVGVSLGTIDNVRRGRRVAEDRTHAAVLAWIEKHRERWLGAAVRPAGLSEADIAALRELLAVKEDLLRLAASGSGDRPLKVTVQPKHGTEAEREQTPK